MDKSEKSMLMIEEYREFMFKLLDKHKDRVINFNTVDEINKDLCRDYDEFMKEFNHKYFYDRLNLIILKLRFLGVKFDRKVGDYAMSDTNDCKYDNFYVSISELEYMTQSYFEEKYLKEMYELPSLKKKIENIYDITN